MKKNELILLIVILLAAFTVRLYRFSAPVADWHSWRQVDTSSVSRNFVEKGFDVLHPTYHDLSNVPSRIDNPKGYRFVEFPVYNFLQAGLFKVFGGFTLEEWGRLVTIFSSFGAAIFLYLLSRAYYGKVVGSFAAFFFAFLPFNIYFHRIVLPDTSMVMASLGSLYFFDKYVRTNKKSAFALCLFLTALAFLFKPYALFFTLPMFVIAYRRWGMHLFANKSLWFLVVGSIAPFLFWRIWMAQYPEGIPQFAWLFNGDGIRFKPSFFYWIFYMRVTKLILGFIGLPLLFLGVFYKRKDVLAMSFLISSLLYLVTIATGNVRHDYYQILIIPTVCLFLALGSLRLMQIIKNKQAGVIAVLIISAVFFRVSWQEVKNFYNVDKGLIEAAKTTDRVIPKDAKFVVSRSGDTTFLYFTKRTGWSSKQSSFVDLEKMGAGYFIAVYPTSEERNLAKLFPVVYNSDTLVIFSLKKQ